MSFSDEFRRECDNAIKASEEVVKLTFFAASQHAVLNSPVANTDLWKTEYPPSGYVGGRFRSNWIPTKLIAATSTTDTIKSESSVLSEVQNVISGAYASTYVLANNLPYAPPIEGGHSTQAPNGVAGPAVSFAESKIPEFTRVANRRYGVE